MSAQAFLLTDSSGAQYTIYAVDGRQIDLQMTSPSLASNAFGTATKNFAKAAAGVVRSIYVTNADAAVRYFQLFAKATAPVAGTDTPITGGSFMVPAGTATAPGVLRLDFGIPGLAIATGIAWAISTTRSTFTDAATAAEHDLALQYV